jgi:hypothetical protein
MDKARIRLLGMTVNGSSTITGDTADADDNGVGGGGGIKVM